MAEKKSDGKWHVDIRPGGEKGPRFRRKFATKPKALEFEAAMIAQFRNAEEWEKKAAVDTRRLSDLIEQWYEIHGKTLSDIKKRMGKLDLICSLMGNPKASKVTAKVFAGYKAKRLEDVKPVTVNKEHAYLRAVFNELKAHGLWDADNPIADIKKVKETKAKLTYYDEDQLKVLLSHCKSSDSRHLELVVRTCLSIGARWEEVVGLKPIDIKKYQIQVKSKTDNDRIVPITQELYERIIDHEKQNQYKIFSDCLSAFRRVVEKSGLPSPEGQLTHVLRHSYAVQYMKGGGNIVDLMNTLGHKTITTTAIYLRFAPLHLEDVPKLNPISAFNL